MTKKYIEGYKKEGGINTVFVKQMKDITDTINNARSIMLSTNCTRAIVKDFNGADILIANGMTDKDVLNHWYNSKVVKITKNIKETLSGLSL